MGQFVQRVTSTKYFRITFIIAILFGFIVFFTISYFYNQSNWQKQVELEEKRLILLESDIVLIMNQMEELTIQLSTLSSLESAISLDSELTIDEKMKIHQDVNNLLGSSKYIDSVTIFFDRSATVYVSNRGMYTLFEYSKKDFYTDEVLASTESMIWLIGDDESENCLVRKLPIISSYYTGAVMFDLVDNFFENAILNLQEDGDNDFFAVYDGKLFYSNEDYLVNLYEENPDISDGDFITINGITYEIVSASADFHPMTFYSLVQSPNLFTGISQSDVILFFVIWVFAAFAVVFVVFAWVLNPLFAIVNYIRSMDQPHPIAQQSNDYNLIHNTLSGLVEKNQTILSLLEESHLTIQDQLMNQLFHGDAPQDAALYEKCNLLNINFPYPFYYAAIVHFINLEDIQNYSLRTHLRLSLNRTIQDTFNQNLQDETCIYSMLCGDNRIAFLCNTKIPVDKHEKLQTLCKTIQEQVYKEFEVSIVFLFGSQENSPDLTYRSYAYANQLRDYSFDQKPEPCLFYSPNLVGTIYNKTLHRTTVQLLLSHHFENLATACRDDIGKLYLIGQKWERVQQLSLLYCISIYFNLIEQELTVPPDILSITLDKIQNLSANDSLESVLLYFLQEIANVISNHSALEDDKQDRINTVLEFIDKHYSEDLTVTQLAQLVHLNSIYLNRLMKERTGNTLSDCLHIRRISQGKKLLRESCLGISEIALQVGYFESRNFTRFFKKYEGKTPSDYRNEV